MTDLEAIVNLSESICNRVDNIIETDNRINVELSIALEKMRLDVERSCNNLRFISSYFGV